LIAKVTIMDSITIVIIENDNVARVGAQYILSEKGMFHIVGVAKNGKDGLAEIKLKNPEVVVVNTDLPDISGVEIISSIKKASNRAKIVAMGFSDKPDVIRKLINNGIDCYYCKFSPKEYVENRLIDVVIAASRNESWIDSTVNRMLINESQSEEKHILNKFTARQIQTLKLMASGMSNKEMASILSVSKGTVRSYVHTLFSKLNASDRINAIRHGISLNIISISDMELDKEKIAMSESEPRRRSKRTNNVAA
jgi:DNA-binding NarL/FixJ family response regulator